MHTSQPKFWKSRAYARRWRTVEVAPAEFTDYIRAFNEESGKPTNARPADASPEFMADLRAALAEMPAPVLALLEARFLGVYLARDLGCSAVADAVLHDGHVIGVAIILDIDAFEHRDANQWATWNEASTLAVAEPGALTATIAHAGDNHRKTALQFLLLHEIGHVLVAGRLFLPGWWSHPDTLGAAGSHDFLDLSWRLDNARQIVPRLERDTALRSRIAGHAQARVEPCTAADLYADLRDTTFATPYAIANAYEDFSECLAIYAHVVLLGRPYEVRLQDAPGHEARIVNDAAAILARCAAKVEFIETLLGLPPSARHPVAAADGQPPWRDPEMHGNPLPLAA